MTENGVNYQIKLTKNLSKDKQNFERDIEDFPNYYKSMDRTIQYDAME